MNVIMQTFDNKSINDFGNRWCKREGVDDNALKE